MPVGLKRSTGDQQRGGHRLPLDTAVVPEDPIHDKHHVPTLSTARGYVFARKTGPRFGFTWESRRLRLRALKTPDPWDFSLRTS